MSSDDVNLDEIAHRRDRLFETFGEVPVVERRKEPTADEFEEWIDISRNGFTDAPGSGYVGSAYAFVRRPPDALPPLSESMEVEGEEREAVLLIQGRGGTQWGIPGGGQEGTERFEETAHREVEEEVGIDVSLTGLEFVRHEIATCDGYDERLHVLRVFFAAEYEGGALTIQPGELDGAAWFSEPPVEDRLMPSTKRLIDNWDPDHELP